MTENSARPNLLVVLTDQQRFDALSCHRPWVRTPHLDELATRGADLRRHYAQAPVCVPSRTTLFTGRYPHAHRVLENHLRLTPHEVHMFKVLQKAGYHLTYHGKNHFLPEPEMSANFAVYTGAGGESEDPARRAYQQLEHEALRRLRTHGSHASVRFHNFPDEATTTGFIAAAAIEAITAAPDRAPWCTVVSFQDPHVPHLAPHRFADWYPLANMPVPTGADRVAPGKAPRMLIKHRAQMADQATDEDRRRYLAAYAGMCSFVDEQVGRILAAVEARGETRNTVVAFVSDHGDFGWEHGLCKKDLMLYDCLLHVPAVIVQPGRITRQVVTESFTEHADLMPTLLDLLDLPVPFGCQGRSFAPLLLGHTRHHRSETHAEVCLPWMRNPFNTYDEFRQAWETAHARGEPLGRAAPYNVPGDYTKSLRTAEWSFIWYGDGFEELYDLRSDPGETRNLANDPALFATCRDLRLRLFEWLVQTADPRDPAVEAAQALDYPLWNLVSVHPGAG